LLTNYKMLDLLLLRAADAPLWSASIASLQFVVLDEFHTYDGAQGTDVAMLLRRLGATARVAEAGRPLGRITPVATSATLGGGDRSPELRDFAQRIFGVPFDPDALVGEQRLAADDVVADVDFNLAIPEVDAICAADTPRSADPESWGSLAKAVLMPPASTDHLAAHDYTDRVEIGDLLRRHFLTRVVVESLADRPLTPEEAVTRITRAGVPPWGVRNATDPHAVEQALVRFLALLSAARVLDPHGMPRPLVTVQLPLGAAGRGRRRANDAGPDRGRAHRQRPRRRPLRGHPARLRAPQGADRGVAVARPAPKAAQAAGDQDRLPGAPGVGPELASGSHAGAHRRPRG
jgi:hypothetical protein